MKSWNKWLRKSHRWLAVPMFILIPISVVLRVSGNGAVMAGISQWEMIQSLLMLFLAVSGAYLFFVPYWAKLKRNQRRNSGVEAARSEQMTRTTL